MLTRQAARFGTLPGMVDGKSELITLRLQATWGQNNEFFFYKVNTGFDITHLAFFYYATPKYAL